VPVFCGMSGWKSAICISVIALRVPMNFLIKSTLCAELVHCTLGTR